MIKRMEQWNKKRKYANQGAQKILSVLHRQHAHNYDSK